MGSRLSWRRAVLVSMMAAVAVTPPALPAAAAPGDAPDLAAVLTAHAEARAAVTGRDRGTGGPDAGGLSASDAPPEDDFDVRYSAVGAVAVGAAHTCAIGPFDDLWCFGDGTAGQLGVSGEGSGPVRVNVDGELTGRAVGAVSAGRTHTCVIAEDDPVAGTPAAYCWGGNDDGQVGDGSTTDRTAPVKVIADAVRIAAGRDHTCALLTTGAVYCWGRNDVGQLGTGTAGAGADTPQPVAGLGEVRDIAANGDTTCAVVAEGEAWCWGSDSDGQLGDGDGPDDAQPAPVAVLAGDVTEGFVSIAVGRRHVCALATTGAVHCWGSDAAGQLGNGPDSGDGSAAVAVRGGGSYVGVAAGGDASCAVGRTGQAYCWGDNTDGQLGTGDHDDRGVPTAVDQGGVRSSPITKIVTGSSAAMLSQVAMGDGHACATEVLGGVYCWGANAAGQLGNGTTTAADVPIATALIPDAARDVRVTPAERALGVGWAAPKDTGVSPVSEYAALAISGTGVDSIDDMQVCTTTTALACRVDDLTNKRPYEVLVGAATRGGVSFTATTRGVPVASGSGGGLPITGGAIGGLVAVAGAFIAAGVLGVALGNRRMHRSPRRTMPS